MLSNVLDRISFWALFLVGVLLPVFFIPLTKIPIENSKGFLLVIGLAISIIFWTAARFSDGKITIPRSYLLFSGVVVVISTLLSALFSTSVNLSLFGIMLDTSSFWFIFCAFLLMLLFSMITRETKEARITLLGLMVSLFVVFAIQFARFFMPETFSFGLLADKADNLIGSWNSFGILSGMFMLISLFALEFFPLNKGLKWLFVVLGIISLFFAMSVNFMLVWELVGFFALLVFVYKISLYSTKRGEEENQKAPFPVFAFTTVMISLLFFMSGQFIGGIVPEKLGINNIEIRPSVGTTFQVTKNSLAKDPILGIGPNRFSELWSSYKPQIINNTQFWNTTFPTASGLIPTFLATGGLFGIFSWFLFFVCFVMAGIKVLFTGIKKGYHSEATLFFFTALYLFVAAFFYSLGVVPILLAFIFTGIFIGLSSKNGGRDLSITFLTDPRKSFFYILGLIVLMILVAGITFKYVERFASVFYYTKALNATTIENAENYINKALLLHNNDVYLRAMSNVYIVKINTLLNKESALTEEERLSLQNNFDRARASAILATEYNKFNYINFLDLGSLYSSAAQLGVEGALDQAIEAYKTASTLNPLNPGIKLNIAQNYLALENTKEARIYAEEALNLKPDYIDAFVVSAQISRVSGDNRGAVSYAEKALALAPSNQQLIKFVEDLKNRVSPQTPVVETEDISTNEN